MVRYLYMNYKNKNLIIVIESFDGLLKILIHKTRKNVEPYMVTGGWGGSRLKLY